MIQPCQHRFRDLDFKAFVYGLTGGICLLFTLMILGPDSNDKTLGNLQENASDFFVRCSTENCSSLIIPFIGYLLNIEEKHEQLFTLWFAITISLSIYLFFKLSQNKTQVKQGFAIAAIPFTLAVLNSFNPSTLITILPCAILAILASVLYTQGGKNWNYFITGAVLFSASMGLIAFGALMCYLMITQEGKQDRRDMVRILQSIAVGYAIITIYLLLIEFNFLEWANTDRSKTNPDNPIFRNIGLICSYFTISITLIIIHAKKIK